MSKYKAILLCVVYVELADDNGVREKIKNISTFNSKITHFWIY